MSYYLWYILSNLEGVELISDAYEESSEYTVLPLENTIYGPVTETLDCFFSRFNPSPSSNSNSRSGVNLEGLSEIQKSIKGKGKEKEIIATLDLPIRHCLVVKRGTRIEDITIVSSHEQVSSTLLPLLFVNSILLVLTPASQGARANIKIQENVY
jgi:prephenate dehydratase